MTRITPVCPNQLPLQAREVPKTDGAGFQETLQKTLATRESPSAAPSGPRVLGGIQPAVKAPIETNPWPVS